VPSSPPPNKTPDTTSGAGGAGRPAEGAGKAEDAAKAAQAGGKSGRTGQAPGRPAQRTATKGQAATRPGKGGGARPGGGKSGKHRPSAAERARTKRRRTMNRIAIGVAVVVVAGAIAALLVSRNISQQAAVRDLNVQTLPNLGQDHLQPGGKYTNYNSTPPTSGPHDPTPAPCGVTKEPIPNEVQVHDLEHGVIMVQYQPDLDPGQVARLEALARSYASHVIVAPYPGLKTPVAATAWTKLMALPNADTDKIRSFIGLYREKGPEPGIPCPASQ
jgi:hypothetical protein